ncbi:MAG TPA: hypothetical protein VF029_04545 [Actinomycetota bacterium]
MGTLGLILVPAALFVGLVIAVLALRDRGRTPGRPPSPLPTGWIVLTAVLLLVGLFVAPRLLGFTFLFLPFIWFAGAGRRRRQR